MVSLRTELFIYSFIAIMGVLLMAVLIAYAHLIMKKQVSDTEWFVAGMMFGSAITMVVRELSSTTRKR